eukprot:5566912-Amphidinium_carterae.2
MIPASLRLEAVILTRVVTGSDDEALDHYRTVLEELKARKLRNLHRQSAPSKHTKRWSAASALRSHAESEELPLRLDKPMPSTCLADLPATECASAGGLNQIPP